MLNKDAREFNSTILGLHDKQYFVSDFWDENENDCFVNKFQ